MSFQDPTILENTGKKRIVRRTKPSESTTTAAVPYDDSIPTQLVHSVEESNALVNRLKQLEGESATLARTLAKVCDENTRLSKENVVMQEKISTLATAPFAGTSVLHSLFEPEKTGWFGGSKSAAKEQVEKLCESLQKEFLEYKATHSASEEEVLSLVTAVQDTTINNQELSKMVQSLQERLTNGPEAIQIRILPVEDVTSQVAIDEIKGQLQREEAKVAELRDKVIELNDNLQSKCTETIQLQNELKALRDQLQNKTSSVTPLKTERDRNDRLQGDMSDLTEALATQEKLNALKTEECRELAERLNSIKAAHAQEVEKLKQEIKGVSDSTCPQCPRYERELEELRRELATSKSETQSLRSQLMDTTTKYEKNSASLEAKLVECQKELSMKASEASRSVSSDDYRRIDLEKKTLEHELSLCKDRIKYLEDMKAKKGAGKETAPTDLDTTQILETLSRNKEKISKLEFDLQQAQLQLKQAQTYAVSRDEDAKRLERSTTEDKQRVAFLLKKCAAATAESRAAVAAKDQLAEQLEEQKSENRRLSRQLEEFNSTKEKAERLEKEKMQLEDRIAGTEELEEKLVRAKETIAYMELAQSKTINMSQYAELQASRDKLENSVAPLKKQLEEANKEVARLRSITEAQHTVSLTQKNSVQGWQDKVNQLSESESKLREQNSALVAENERLKKLNESLESQMSDMQDGIKEMAVTMEQCRSTAKESADAQSEKEIARLKSDLERANNIIANVEANNSQFVSEALYKAAVDERNQLKEENTRKGAEMEKLKSEILIYRQTIVDLESENDEHVKQIEQLQEKYQQERNLLSDKLLAEQKKCSELKESTATLKEELSTKESELTGANESIKTLNEQISKQRRAFEDKSRSEEALRASLAKLQEETGRAVEMPSAASATPSVSPPRTPAAATAPSDFAGNGEALYKLQCENDRLKGELSRLQRRHKQTSEEDDKTIIALQTQIRNKLSGDSKEAYDIEVEHSRALQRRIDELNEEIKILKQSSSKAPAVVPVSNPKDTNDEEVEQLRKRIEELEEQLEENAPKGNETPIDANTGAERPKKKIKKIKKKKTTEDVVGNESIDATPTPRPHKAEAKRSPRPPTSDESSEILLLKEENEALKKENASLQESIAKLNDELDEMSKELEAAQNEVEMDRHDYHRRISMLEDTERERSDYFSQTTSTNVSFSKQSLQDVEMQLRCAKDENERLRLELQELKSTAVGAEAAQELKNLRKQIRQKDAEILALTDQLMPTKQKLVEYMAVTDRLGLSYPFPAELEGKTVMRLKALHKSSKGHSSLPPDTTPSPPKESRGRSKRSKKVDFPDEDDLR